MLHGPKPTQRLAQSLRREMSLPEILLWRVLRTKPDGLKFRRQHPSGPYVLDFFCASKRLAIEIDGEAHGRGDRPQRDAARDAWLVSQGITVIRIPAADLLGDVEAAVLHIMTSARRDYPSTTRYAGGPPPPPGEDP
jgi:very-short-patch-repair endonuclease